MTWDEIKKAVEDGGNVVTFTMEQLRNANGSGKLGTNVRADISQKLAGMGLGRIPQWLPSYQNELVRIYKMAQTWVTS